MYRTLRAILNNRFLLNLSILFLFPVFFILHGYNENFGLIPLGVLLSLFSKYVSIVTIIFILGFIFLRDIFKTVVFSFFLLCIYFFFGAVHDGIKSIGQGSFWASYSFILSFISISIVALLIYLKRSEKKFKLSRRYVQYFLAFICFWELAIFLTYTIIGKGQTNNLAKEPVGLKLKEPRDKTEKPDIFFIIFDGYTSSNCLKEEFEFDNSKTDSLLLKSGFFISKESRSNYNVTPFSLSSTFNLNYLKEGVGSDVISSKIFIQAIETFKNNEIIKFLKKEGYTIKNYGCFDINGAPAQVTPYFNTAYYKQIDNQTLISRTKQDIGWFFSTKNIFTGSFKLPQDYKENKRFHLYRNTYNLSGLIRELKNNSDSPKFVYAHLMLPHEPFFLDSNGKEVADKAIIMNSINLKEGYLNQLKYSNRLLKTIVPLISQTSGNRVVILEGDHGFRNYDSILKMNKEFMNLNAYFFSDKDYNTLYNGISPVNSFRVILNKYFGSKLPLIKDSSFYISQNVSSL